MQRLLCRFLGWRRHALCCAATKLLGCGWIVLAPLLLLVCPQSASAQFDGLMPAEVDLPPILPAGEPPPPPRIFEREPFGFGLSSIRELLDGARALGERLVAWFASWGELSALEVASTVLPWLIVLAFVLFTAGSDRRFRRLATQWAQAVIDRQKLRPSLALLAAAAVRVFGRVLAFGLALILSFVPVRGMYPDMGWPSALSTVLIALLSARLLAAVAKEALNWPTSEIPLDTRRRLERVIRLCAWFLAVTFSLDAVASGLGANEEISRLAHFVFRVALALVGSWAFMLRADALIVVAAQDRTQSSYLWQLVERMVGWVLGISTALLWLYALGYHQLAISVLPRSYAALGLLAAAFSLKRAAERWWSADPERQSRGLRRLLSPFVEPFGRFCLYVALALVALDLVALYDPLIALIRRPLFVVGHTPITVFNIVKAVFILMGAELVSRVLRVLLDELVLTRKEVDEGLSYAVTTTLHYFLIAFGGGVALVTVGLDLSALAVFAGALGVGLGLGLQEVARNVVSGFILLYGGGVKKGDVITVNDKHFGRVSSIGARSVSVRTYDDVDLVIPSSELVNSTIINWTRRTPVARLHLSVPVSYKSDIWAVREALLAAAARCDRIAPNTPTDVWLVGYQDSAIEFDLLVWVDVARFARDDTLGKLRFLVFDTLKERGIEIPFPQQDIHVRTYHAPIPLNAPPEKSHE
jgi:small-conductance mechanosensitive channel